MDLLHRSFSKLTHLCVNQDAKIATIRAVIVATILAGLLILLMNLSEANDAAVISADAEAGNQQASLNTSPQALLAASFRHLV